MEKGLINLDMLVTHRIKIADYKKALTVARNKGEHGLINRAFEF